MKKATLKNCAAAPRDDGFIMIPMFGPDTKPNQAVHMGFVEFTPGMRMPAEGAAAHDSDEFSYFLSGSITCCSGGETMEYRAGDAIYIPAGEAHYSVNNGTEPCTLIYMQVKTI